MDLIKTKKIRQKNKTFIRKDGCVEKFTNQIGQES
jgi:hypothetical protein